MSPAGEAWRAEDTTAKKTQQQRRHNTCILDLHFELVVAELQGPRDALQVVDEHARIEQHRALSEPQHRHAPCLAGWQETGSQAGRGPATAPSPEDRRSQQFSTQEHGKGAAFLSLPCFAQQPPWPGILHGSQW